VRRLCHEWRYICVFRYRYIIKLFVLSQMPHFRFVIVISQLILLAYTLMDESIHSNSSLLLLLQFQNSPLPQFENVVKLKVDRRQASTLRNLHSFVASELSIESFTLDPMDRDRGPITMALDDEIACSQKFMYLSVVFNGTAADSGIPLSILGNCCI